MSLAPLVEAVQKVTTTPDIESGMKSASLRGMPAVPIVKVPKRMTGLEATMAIPVPPPPPGFGVVLLVVIERTLLAWRMPLGPKLLTLM